VLSEQIHFQSVQASKDHPRIPVEPFSCAMEPICSQRRQSDLWWSFSQMYRCIDAHWQFCPRPKSTAESVWMHCSTLMQAKASQYTWCSAHSDPRITYWFWRTVSQHFFQSGSVGTTSQRSQNHLLFLAYCVPTHIVRSSFFSAEA
jgi:hypothetical protein